MISAATHYPSRVMPLTFGVAALVAGAFSLAIGATMPAILCAASGLAAVAAGGLRSAVAVDPGLEVLRSIAARSRGSDLPGSISAVLRALAENHTGDASVVLVRRENGPICDTYSLEDGRIVVDELLWQPALLDQTNSTPPPLPARLPRPHKWHAAIIPGPGEPIGGVLVLNPERRADRWLENVLEIVGWQLGEAIARERAASQVDRGFVETIETLIGALEAKDTYTAGHSSRVSKYSVAIAAELGLSEDEITEIRTGAMLHDIGKIGIGDGVLTKPGKLSDEEFTEIKDHPRRGARIIDRFNRSRTVLSVVFHHHERYDGRGYPAGLRGVDIPLSARIVNVADAFDAMTTNRPYGRTKPPGEALLELRQGAGSQFDPRVVTAFETVFQREGTAN